MTPSTDDARGKKKADMSIPSTVYIAHQPDAEFNQMILQFRANGMESAKFPTNREQLITYLQEGIEAGFIIDNQSENQLIEPIIDALLSSSSMVVRPKHYQLPGLNGLEWLDVRKALMQTIPPEVPHEIAADYREMATYIARMWGKNGLEDAKKARFYLNKMITELEELQ